MRDSATSVLLERESELREVGRAVEQARAGAGRLVVVVRPPPLSQEAVAELAERAFGEPVDPRFRDACREASGGNPFLLRELLRELVADGVAPRADSAALVGQLAPPTVARAVLLRL